MKHCFIALAMFFSFAAAGAVPGKEWGFAGPGSALRRTASGLEVSIPPMTGTKRITAIQLLQNRTLSPDRLYMLTLELESSQDQSREIVVTYRGRRFASKLGYYEVFHLKKGGNLIRCVIRPDSPRKGDAGVISIQLGLQHGRITLARGDLQEVDYRNRKKLPFSEEWILQTEYGKERVQIATGLAAGGMKLDIGARHPGFKSQARAILTNTFTAESDGEMLIGCAGDWYWRCSINGTSLYHAPWLQGNKAETKTPDNHIFPIFWKKGVNRFQVEVRAGKQGWMFCWGTPAEPAAPVKLDAAAGYLPIRMDNLEIRKGSALDLSALIPAPAGKSGRVVIAPGGRLALEHDPAPFRMFGSSSGLPLSCWGPDVPDAVFAENARRIAQTMRRQGYNVFRLHGFDEWIMWETSKPLEQGRFLDRWDRLAAEMKKEGIYLHLVLFSFGLYEPRDRYSEIYRRRNMHKARMFLNEPWEMTRFRDAAKMLLNHVNPYTGLAWKDDPSVAVAEIYNEQTMAIRTFVNMKHAYPADYRLMLDRWRAFLKHRYADVPDAERPVSVRGKALESAPIPDGRTGDLNDDYNRFWYELVRESNLRCTQILRENGYRGIVDNLTEPQLNIAAASWNSIPVHDAHTYLGFPGNWDRPGSKLSDMGSPIGRDASFFRKINGVRLAGRPFFCGEYNHSYWNPYQYELPLGFAAYAAFADWSSMMIHEQAVLLNDPAGRRCHIFSVGDNPVHRCGQFLSSLLFLRRDVRTAKHVVRRMIPADAVFRKGRGGQTISDAQNRLALITRCELAFSGLPPCRGACPLPPATLTLTGMPATSEVGTHEWYTEVSSGSQGWDALKRDLQQLRSAGILTSLNRTDPERGIWQTDTGEITLFAKEKSVRLVTEKTSAVTLTRGAAAEAGNWKFRSSADALLYAAAVDGKNLSDSRRIVVGFATRAANTGLELEPDGETIRRWGTAPVCIKTGKFQAEFSSSARNLQAYALAMDGTRQEKLKLQHTADGKWLFSVDTAKLKNGPAVFFEITEP